MCRYLLLLYSTATEPILGTLAQFCLNLQTRYDLEVENDRSGLRLDVAVAVAVYAAASERDMRRAGGISAAAARPPPQPDRTVTPGWCAPAS